MSFREFIKPTKRKIIITIICVLIVPTLLGIIWDVFDLPGEFTVLLSPGIITTYANIHCYYAPGGIDWTCYVLKTAYWWSVNLIVYYLLVSIVYFKFKK